MWAPFSALPKVIFRRRGPFAAVPPMPPQRLRLCVPCVPGVCARLPGSSAEVEKHRPKPRMVRPQWGLPRRSRCGQLGRTPPMWECLGLVRGSDKIGAASTRCGGGERATSPPGRRLGRWYTSAAAQRSASGALGGWFFFLPVLGSGMCGVERVAHRGSFGRSSSVGTEDMPFFSYSGSIQGRPLGTRTLLVTLWDHKQGPRRHMFGHLGGTLVAPPSPP